jgi:hypothetical protein
VRELEVSVLPYRQFDKPGFLHSDSNRFVQFPTLPLSISPYSHVSSLQSEGRRTTGLLVHQLLIVKAQIVKGKSSETGCADNYFVFSGEVLQAQKLAIRVNIETVAMKGRVGPYRFPGRAKGSLGNNQ